MRKLILMAKDKASRLSDEDLTKEIADLASGSAKLYSKDEQGRRVNLSPMILVVLKEEEARRRGTPKV